ncbi:Mg chelatase-like protein [Frondihabitans australicus]|uniref:Mg chelatase-like protein n=1 Tax=Frondihabitans australicus TaxID=386892 RepID=A0A495IF77_9MICO|nr:ATP-binding protein [Frondihabitans australicus]RKR73686.1 Mg chelatase-like protein [Frondihabitans australicus]
MSVARTRAVSLLGLTGALVEIEADMSDGLPGFLLIGLPDASLGEARDRVRAAASNSGCPLPPRKLTVNLSPASLPKHGSSFDLGIAVAALAAADLVDRESIERVVHLGELGLDGRLRPVNGILPAVLGAARAGAATIMVPSANADEASLVPDVRIVAVPSLRDAAIWHGGDFAPEPVEAIARETPAQSESPTLELGDVIGNPAAVDALIVAASGGHHLLMVGPPGAGKSMLAARLPGILPDLDVASSLEVSSLRSLSGRGVAGALEVRPPFESPHHSCSAAALVGGGSSVIRPGAASLASRGVLFLDEAPEFAVSVLDCLRQPLESGEVTIHRSRAVARFPARFQLVVA